METVLHLGDFTDSTPGDDFYVGHLDTNGAILICQDIVAATGTLALEHKAVAGAITSGYFLAYEYQTNGSLATITAVDISVNLEKFLHGQYQYIRVNPTVATGTVRVWLVCKRKR